MNGIPSTKLGGIASQRRVYGPRQNTFRFYKILFPDNERSRIDTGDAGSQVINYLNIQDKLDGDNLLDNTRVTLSSNYLSETALGYLLTQIRLPEPTTWHYTHLEAGHNVYIQIDFKYPQYIHSYSMLFTGMSSGWRMFGSHDGVVWEFLHDVPNEVLEPFGTKHKESATIATRPTPYQVNFATGLPIMGDPITPYNIWAVRPLLIRYGYEYNRFYTLEFRDGLGGSNLCVGGTVDRWPSSSFTLHTNAFDGNDTTQALVYSYDGVGYTFSNPILKPPVVAIHSGESDEEVPQAFYLVSSNNGKLWYYHGYYEIPAETWPTGTYTTQEFEL